MKTPEEIKKIEDQLKELSKQIPATAVRQMAKVLKNEFQVRDIPYDVSHLQACLISLEIALPALPPMYSEVFQASRLIIYRLIDEIDKNEIPSEFIIPGK